MLKYLGSKKATQFGIDQTFKIIPKSFLPYKMMSIYALKPKKGQTIAPLIILKYSDLNSLVKIFSLLNVLFRFSPISVTVDFDLSQIKSLKNCDKFINKSYIMTCLFHFEQSIMKKWNI